MTEHLDTVLPSHAVRAELVEQVGVLKDRHASLVRMKQTENREERLAQLKQEIGELVAQIKDLDEVEALCASVAKITTPPLRTTSTTTLHEAPSPIGTSSAGHTTSRPVAQNVLAPIGNRTSTTKVPANLPLFGRGHIIDVDEFLDRLTNSLLAHNLESSCWTSALVLGCAESTDATWVRTNLLHLPWEQAQQLFLARYRDPFYRVNNLRNFHNLRKRDDEDMLSFSSKFRRLATILSIDASTLIPQFISAMPDDIAAQLQLFYVSSPDVTLDLLIQTAISFDRRASAQKPSRSQVMHHDYVENNRGRNAVDNNRSRNDVDSNNNRSRNAVDNNRSRDAVNNNNHKYCRYHKRRGHDTSECWSLERKHGQSSSPVAPTTPPPPPGDRVVKAQPSVLHTPWGVCRTCGQRGHYAAECPQGRASSAALDVTQQLDQCLFGPGREEVSSKVVSHQVSILLNSRPVLALIDSGSSASFIDTALVEELSCGLRDITTQVQLGHLDRSVTISSRTHPLLCELGLSSTTHPFLVMPLPDFLLPCRCILGRDVFHQLGIAIQIKSTPETVIAINASEVPEDIAAALQKNTEIPPSSRCIHPDSIIPIDTGDSTPIFKRQYRIPEKLVVPVTEVVKRWIAEGVVCRAPAGAVWNSPLLAVPKSDGSVRVCLDPRHINAILRTGDNFPIPVVADMVDRFAGAVVFSALDLKNGYNQFTIREQDRPKLSFTWEGLQYMFVGAPFGLRHLSSAFQRVISDIFADMNFCLIYIDNIYVFSRDNQSHSQHLLSVINRLNDFSLRLNLSKCSLFQRRISFLGHVISENGLEIDKTKLVDLNDLPEPTSAKQMRAFLGFVNFFRAFIPGLSSMAASLDRLRNTEHFILSEEQRKAFNDLKQALILATPLSLPRFDRPFALACDASDVGLGAVLLQPPVGSSHDDLPNPTWSVVACFSRALSASEKKYSATKRELLAIIFGLRKSRYYLFGRKFVVFSDHRALSFLHSQQHESQLFSRWIDELAEFDFDIRYLPGVANVLPDALSRLYPVCPSRVSSLPLSLSPPVQLLQSPSEEEKLRLLQQAHALGHFGAKAVANRIREAGFSWPTLLAEAQKQVDECSTCQRFLVRRTGFHPLTNVTSNEPMQHVAIDLAGPLVPSFRGNLYILVCMCVFTRFCFLCALPNKEATTVAAALYSIFCGAGFPQVIQSDQGLEFNNTTMAKLVELINADHRLSTPYHPRANGVAERWVQSTLQTVRKMAMTSQRDWDLTLPGTQFALNTRVVSNHGSAPFSLFFARASPLLRSHAFPATVSSDTKNWEEVLSRMEEVIFPAIVEGRDSRNKLLKDNFDAKNKIVSFAPGSYVMTSDPTRTGKLDPRREGPFKIARVTKGGSYWLFDHDGTILERSFAPNQLLAVPTPKQTSTESVFTIEKILAHRGELPAREYLVRWKGFTSADDSWVPESDFLDLNILSKYWKSICPSSSSSSSESTSTPQAARRPRGRPPSSTRKISGAPSSSSTSPSSSSSSSSTSPSSSSSSSSTSPSSSSSSSSTSPSSSSSSSKFLSSSSSSSTFPSSSSSSSSTSPSLSISSSISLSSSSSSITSQSSCSSSAASTSSASSPLSSSAGSSYVSSSSSSSSTLSPSSCLPSSFRVPGPSLVTSSSSQSPPLASSAASTPSGTSSTSSPALSTRSNRATQKPVRFRQDIGGG